MMKQSRPVVLLTRPAPQSQRFADEMMQQFGPMDVIISPILAPQYLHPSPAPATAAVIFSSETGVEGAVQADIWPKGDAPKTAYCVGTRTAQAAIARGFTVVDAQGDWRDLVHLIQNRQPAQDMTFACAAEAPDHLQKALEQAGYTVHRREVYRQDPVPLIPEALRILAASQPVVLPLFSPRSAQIFCDFAGPCAAPLWLAALSPQVMAAFSLTHDKYVVANRPNSAALLDSLRAFLQNPNDMAPNP